MKLKILVLLSIALVLPVHAGEERSGLLYALVDVQDGAASITEVHTTLPDSIVEKLAPVVHKRALDEAALKQTDEATVAVGIDWRVVTQDGKEQMAFDFSNSESLRLEYVQPETPPSVYGAATTVIADITVGISATGELDLLACNVNEARFGDACTKVLLAMKRWVFTPKFVNGVGKPSRARMNIRFDFSR
ncbi:MAG: hypothetical protein R3217_08375 [Gammaproteobacteria bacterium]|nr:hypothetical protein [Gammaproteobacteria bacterium]